MTKKSVKSYQGVYFESSCIRTEQYNEFEKACYSELKKMCKANGYNLHTFNKNHFIWSAVLERGGNYYYVSISDVRYFNNWYNNILVRTMKNPIDWLGGINNYCSWNHLADALERLYK